MIIKIQVKPSAKKTEILEERADFLKVAISAPAFEGRANRELIKFLKKTKGWKAEIVKGKTNKNKLIRII
jgi:uncharacterized protein